MNKQEFELWKAETNRSAHRWVMDAIHDGRGGRDLLVFRGGVDGMYFNIDQSGKVEIGKYQGAIPHIGEALFSPSADHQCDDFDSACKRLLVALGAEFLLEYVGIKL